MTQTNKQLVRRYYEEVVSMGAIDRVVGGRIIEHGGAAILLEPLLNIGAIQIVE